MDNQLTRSKLDQLFGWAELHLRLSHWRGIAVALMVAASATFLSEHYGAPTMLFALLIGLSLGFLAEVPALEGGLNFTAKTILRLGVGLLGIRLGFDDVQAIGGSVHPGRFRHGIRHTDLRCSAFLCHWTQSGLWYSVRRCRGGLWCVGRVGVFLCIAGSTG